MEDGNDVVIVRSSENDSQLSVVAAPNNKKQAPHLPLKDREHHPFYSCVAAGWCLAHGEKSNQHQVLDCCLWWVGIITRSRRTPLLRWVQKPSRIGYLLRWWRAHSSWRVACVQQHTITEEVAPNTFFIVQWSLRRWQTRQYHGKYEIPQHIQLVAFTLSLPLNKNGLATNSIDSLISFLLECWVQKKRKYRANTKQKQISKLNVVIINQ